MSLFKLKNFIRQLLVFMLRVIFAQIFVLGFVSVFLFLNFFVKLSLDRNYSDFVACYSNDLNSFPLTLFPLVMVQSFKISSGIFV